MTGPHRRATDQREWRGVACESCDLKSLCTKGKSRTLVVDAESERLRGKMRERMAEPGAQARYNQRIATVEPVFSSIEDVMGFRRAASRRTRTVASEVLLRVLAHNLDRLHRHGGGRGPSRLLAVFVSAVTDPSADRILCLWAPIWGFQSGSESSKWSEGLSSPRATTSASVSPEAPGTEVEHGIERRILFVASV